MHNYPTKIRRQERGGGLVLSLFVCFFLLNQWIRLPYTVCGAVGSGTALNECERIEAPLHRTRHGHGRRALDFARQGHMGVEGLQIRRKTRRLGLALQHVRECLRGGAFARAQGDENLRPHPVRQFIELQHQRARRHEGPGNSPGDVLEFRDAALGHAAEERQRGMQVLQRHRSSGAGADSLAGRRGECGAGCRVRPEPEEEPAARLFWLRGGAQAGSVRGGFARFTGRSSRRMSRSACCTERLRTKSRSPSKSFSSAMMSIARSWRAAAQNHTVPTGFPGAPPSGPAMPLTASATVAAATRNAPSAISRTVCSLTAPKRSSVPATTPRSRLLAVLE